jgi:hypothetical protein
MRTIRDHFTQQVCNSLKTTSIGLGLVRLLQDAGRNEEAKTIFSSLVQTSQAPLVTDHSLERSRSSAQQPRTCGAGARRWPMTEASRQPDCSRASATSGMRSNNRIS